MNHSRLFTTLAAGTLAACGASSVPDIQDRSFNKDEATTVNYWAEGACETAYAAAVKAASGRPVVSPGIREGEAGRLFLSFADGAQRDAAFAALAGATDLGLVRGVSLFSYRFLPTLVLDLPAVPVGLVEKLAARLAPLGLVSIFPDQAVEFHLSDSADFIGVGRARQDFGLDGTGVGIAIIDSGINELQGDFANVGANIKILTGNPLADETGAPQAPVPNTYQDVTGTNSDTNTGHGTHVAGIAAGTGARSAGKFTGMAPGATLVALSAGEGGVLLYVLSAFDWIANPENQKRFNIRVINNSYGFSPALPDSHTAADLTHPVNLATHLLQGMGVYSVFSAGNSGGGNGSASNLNGYSSSPCAISTTSGISNFPYLNAYNPVNSFGEGGGGGVESIFDPGDRRGRLSWFASTGLKGDPRFHPDITAPGDMVVSAYAGPTAAGMFAGTGGPYFSPSGLNPFGISEDPTVATNSAFYYRAAGTSMAAPHITGIVALLLQARPELKLDDILQLLTGTATPMSKPDGSAYEVWQVGAGFVNVDAALAAALNRVPFRDLQFKKLADFEGSIAEAVGLPAPAGVIVSAEAIHDIELPPGDYRYLDAHLTWEQPANDIDLWLLSADGTELARSENYNAQYETLRFEGIVPGKYKLRVRGWVNGPDSYKLAVSAYQFVSR